MTVTLPLADPELLGANLTLNDVLCPAFKVSGRDNPLMLKPVPLADAAEIVTLEPPLLVNVPERLLLLPTWTLPKPMLAGLDVSDP